MAKRKKVLALFEYADKKLVCASSWARQVLLEMIRRENEGK